MSGAAPVRVAPPFRDEETQMIPRSLNPAVVCRDCHGDLTSDRYPLCPRCGSCCACRCGEEQR